MVIRLAVRDYSWLAASTPHLHSKRLKGPRPCHAFQQRSASKRPQGRPVANAVAARTPLTTATTTAIHYYRPIYQGRGHRLAVAGDARTAVPRCIHTLPLSQPLTHRLGFCVPLFQQQTRWPWQVCACSSAQNMSKWWGLKQGTWPGRLPDPLANKHLENQTVKFKFFCVLAF